MSAVVSAPGSGPEPAPRRISVVIPARNERAGLSVTLDEVYRALAGCGLQPEVVVVDDGSTDGTFERLRELTDHYPNLRALRLSRNYGKEAALLAGLQAARGDVVVTMDADLQHPPSVIPEMLARWREGARVVHGIKRQASGTRRRDRLASSGFNRVMRWLTGIDMHHASDFTLLDRSVVDVIVGQLPERQRFYRALTRWVGFRQESVRFDVPPRADGTSRWSFLRLLDLALTGIVSFTSLPLRLVTVLGLVTLVFAALVAAETLWSWAHGTAVSGYSTIIITLLFIGSSIMISLGILGEYVARIYHEVKARPGFLVEERAGSQPPVQRDDACG
jgi:glycosyltransferase involved in cell wall biosynthesis